MADKDDSNDKKKKKSIIASLDLKNYKAKYTDSYGLGKPNDANLDNFLIAEPDPKDEAKKEAEKIAKQETSKAKTKVNIVPVPTASTPTSATTPKIATENNKKDPVIDKSTIKQTSKSSSDFSIRDSDFERRVNAEADNDFYDEKPVQQIGDTFRSNVIKRKSSTIENPIDDSEVKDIKPNRKLNLREPVTVNVRHEIRDRSEDIEIDTEEKKPVRRTETYGIIISAVAFVYSIFTKDKPLLFLSVSLLLYLMRPIIAAPFGKYSQPVQNAIKGFSMALFLGSIFFIFF